MIYIYILCSLFFGCKHERHGEAECPINISSIRDISRATNYQEIIQAVTVFDNILSGNESKPSSSVFSIVSHLLNDANKRSFNPFLYQTFKSFLDKKKEVTLNMWLIYRGIKDIEFLGLIFGKAGLSEFEYDKNKSNNYFIPCDNTNIPINIIHKFNNIQKINIRWAQNYYKYYSFSLFSFLSLLELHTTIKQVHISGYRSKDCENTSWLSFVWTRDSLLLMREYNKKGYSIAFEEYDTISINKMN